MLISLTSFDSLAKKIARLNKRLAKKNLPLITYTSEKEIHTFKELFDEIVLKHYDFNPSWAIEIINFNITSDVKNWIIESGYEIVAVIDHNENIVHNFVEDADVEEFRERRVCDHCHTKRNRSKSVILRDESGKFIQVGTTCLSDFVNADVDDLVNGMALCAEDFRFTERDAESFYGGSFRENYIHYELSEAIPVIHRAIKKDGFAPSSSGMASTKYLAYKVLNYEERLNVKKEDTEVTPKIIEWMSSLENTSSFNGNLIQIAKNGYVSYKTLGFLCAAVNSYLSESIKKEIKKEIKSEHVGNVGDKITVEVILTKVSYFDSFYGMMAFYIFTDTDGNVFVWKTANDIKYEIGDKFTIKGTVKEHSEYRGVKQTILTRVKTVK